MTIRELEDYAQQCINKNKELKEIIVDFVDICKDNIEEGKDEQTEIELCIKDINELM